MKELAALQDVLEAERAALLSGRLQDVIPLAERKLALIGSLQAIPGNRALPEDVSASAKRNAALLEAAARGIKSALARIEDIKSAAITTTYDARGARLTITSPDVTRGTRA
jgi:flagellar biosynthesis/type III secretory pathway chaperone